MSPTSHASRCAPLTFLGTDYKIPPICIALGASYFQRLLLGNHDMAVSPALPSCHPKREGRTCAVFRGHLLTGLPPLASHVCLLVSFTHPEAQPSHVQELMADCGFFVNAPTALAPAPGVPVSVAPHPMTAACECVMPRWRCPLRPARHRKSV